MAKCFTCRSIVIAKEMHENGGVHYNIGRDSNYRRFRVFAIGNYVNQRLLWPVHDWLAKVLQRLPVDGTFDQLKPLDRLVGNQVTYCYD